MDTISISDYLASKNIPFREAGNELVTRCLFSGCDNDSKGNEAHLYFSVATGQYQCHKCGISGNLHTLAKFFGDPPVSLYAPTQFKERRQTMFSDDLVLQCHSNLPDYLRSYLNTRGIPEHLIKKYKIGFLKLGKVEWLTIPIADITGQFKFFKLRKSPKDKSDAPKYKVWPSGNRAELFGRECLKSKHEHLFICEGEFDKLVLEANGIDALSSTAGAENFKESWLDEIRGTKNIYIVFDTDEAGIRGADKLKSRLTQSLRDSSVYTIALLDRMTDGKDVSDFFVRYGGSKEQLMNLAVSFHTPERIDVSKFHPMNTQDLINILSLTIKMDDTNKVITFLCLLSAYTENSQFNVAFNAPSSTGKSYIPTEIATLFPKEDVLEIAYASPASFFHDARWSTEEEMHVLDLSRKILIFLDQPHSRLLERMRPMLSHDKKVLISKISDKAAGSGNKTKNIKIIGYPAIVYCTANVSMDEQEATRLLLLSPEINENKIRMGIMQTIKKSSDISRFTKWLHGQPERQMLMQRIQSIKHEGVSEIIIPNQQIIEKRFFEQNRKLQSRHQRDIKRLIGLIKCLALLNLWWREKDAENNIMVTQADIEDGFDLWGSISSSQVLGITPYVHEIFERVIKPLWAVHSYCTRQQMAQKYFEIFHSHLDRKRIRDQILPTLETDGLIIELPSKDDKRLVLIYPPDGSPIHDVAGQDINGGINRGTDTGVDKVNEEKVEDVILKD